ncbi:MAG: hypothetical protein A3G34_12765 [Candidatus Lindowbacteria bacterium RIFCSPLOWO2_12_FULL_62_27]|nr:MAG: hypothetical protein A3G34_12765 [Candidatus Lindowbacteria bacterium RIFCSPLOWO2_12_FULL_62_27]
MGLAMARILVSGLINIETTLRVEGFPVAYEPVRYPFHGVRSTVSGVGFNVAKALTALGDEVRFLSLIGHDAPGDLARRALCSEHMEDRRVLAGLSETPQSVILCDPAGRRQIHVDLKDIQERAYPADAFDEALDGCAMAALCNINFSRPFLDRARRRGVPIATDVHAIADPDDDYNRDFMAAADVLFMSHEKLPCPPREWLDRLRARYRAGILAVGLGPAGALVFDRRSGVFMTVPAVSTRPVATTIGAGDALFSAFIHFYAKSADSLESILRASIYASWKIGATGAADGLLDEPSLERMVQDKRDEIRVVFG